MGKENATKQKGDKEGMMELQEYVRILRRRKGMSQEDLAEVMGVKRAHYSYLERSGESMSVRQLRQVAAGLGVEVGELLSCGGDAAADYLSYESSPLQYEGCGGGDTGSLLEVGSLIRRLGYLEKQIAQIKNSGLGTEAKG